MLAWKELVEDPNLKDLPYKIETNEWGQIVMTPARVKHGNYQTKIVLLIRDLLQRPGESVVECAIQTSKGTKVADVAWFSEARWKIVEDQYDVSLAPEICVEVISPGNTGGEISEKRGLYFEAGALEVWVCNAEATMRFYDPNGEHNHSAPVSNFPKKLK